MFTDIMIDLETLDTTPRAAILSIGAVAFNRGGLAIGDDPYATFHVCTQSDFSRYEVSRSTFAFWMAQNDAARLAVLANSQPLRDSLVALREFWTLNMVEGATVWCLPGAFDLPILENAFRVEGVTAPWKYDAGACLRTVYKLAGITKEDRVKPTLAHDALADAIAQVATLRLALKRINCSIPYR